MSRNLLISFHAFLRHILKSFFVDKILVLRYVKWSTKTTYIELFNEKFQHSLKVMTLIKK